MILIEDYRNLRRYAEPDIVLGSADYLGRDVTVMTTAGTSYSGVMVENNCDTITLAHRRRSDRTDRRVVIMKAHIVAVESVLE